VDDAHGTPRYAVTAANASVLEDLHWEAAGSVDVFS